MMVEINKISDVVCHIEGLKAVIFDLDDTLYSEKEYVRSGYHAVAKRLPQLEDVEQKLWNAFEHGKSAVDDVLINEGIYTEKMKQSCLETYRCHQPDIHLYDGVLPMLVELRKEGFLTGIITDGRPEGQRAKIKALGLEQYMNHIIITDEFGGTEYRKPNQKAFVLMKEYFSVDYDEMCYVGDNIKKDFIAPEKLGIRMVWFRNIDGLYSS